MRRYQTPPGSPVTALSRASLSLACVEKKIFSVEKNYKSDFFSAPHTLQSLLAVLFPTGVMAGAGAGGCLLSARLRTIRPPSVARAPHKDYPVWRRRRKSTRILLCFWRAEKKPRKQVVLRRKSTRIFPCSCRVKKKSKKQVELSRLVFAARNASRNPTVIRECWEML